MNIYPATTNLTRATLHTSVFHIYVHTQTISKNALIAAAKQTYAHVTIVEVTPQANKTHLANTYII